MNTLPEPRIAKVLPLIDDRWQEAANALCRDSGEWRRRFGPAAQRVFATHICAIGADEGTVWLLDEEAAALVPAYNNGPQAGEFVGRHLQPLDRGIVSSVFVSQQGLCENWVCKHAGHDPDADRKMGVVTVHMIVVPFYFGGEVRGVLSAVKLRRSTNEADDPEPFRGDALQQFSDTADLLGEWIDGRLLTAAIGL